MQRKLFEEFCAINGIATTDTRGALLLCSPRMRTQALLAWGVLMGHGSSVVHLGARHRLLHLVEEALEDTFRRIR